MRGSWKQEILLAVKKRCWLCFLTTTDWSNRKTVSGRKVTGEERRIKSFGLNGYNSFFPPAPTAPLLALTLALNARLGISSWQTRGA